MDFLVDPDVLESYNGITDVAGTWWFNVQISEDKLAQ
jgi:hypothetical protein